ncbi:enoyl-CoA hydratase/isomerase family protein [Fictibacillus iocasae]|uniref:Enoyl-CoA hydratase/isomerase family protein n=1 Tax=Fictibacillus iocasae TaxID=2715437 RepID=A0ABW2NTV0_9BACL
MPSVLYEVKDEIAWLTINRPQIRNAVNFEVMALMKQYIKQAAEAANVKILVVTGSGAKAFCSGGDLSAFHSLNSAAEAHVMLSEMGSVLKALFYFPKLSAALLNGAAVGGGCEMASACDIRLSAGGVKVGFIQGSLGISTGWGGGSYLLERMPASEALDMLCSASLFTAKQAYEKKFLQYVFKDNDLKGAAAAYLKRYTAQPLGVIQSYKQLFLDRVDRGTLEGRVAEEIKRCSYLWESDEHHERVRRFLGK